MYFFLKSFLAFSAFYYYSQREIDKKEMGDQVSEIAALCELTQISL